MMNKQGLTNGEAKRIEGFAFGFKLSPFQKFLLKGKISVHFVTSFLLSFLLVIAPVPVASGNPEFSQDPTNRLTPTVNPFQPASSSPSSSGDHSGNVEGVPPLPTAEPPPLGEALPLQQISPEAGNNESSEASRDAGEVQAETGTEGGEGEGEGEEEEAADLPEHTVRNQSREWGGNGSVGYVSVDGLRVSVARDLGGGMKEDKIYDVEMLQVAYSYRVPGYGYFWFYVNVGFRTSPGGELKYLPYQDRDDWGGDQRSTVSEVSAGGKEVAFHLKVKKLRNGNRVVHLLVVNEDGQLAAPILEGSY